MIGTGDDKDFRARLFRFSSHNEVPGIGEAEPALASPLDKLVFYHGDLVRCQFPGQSHPLQKVGQVKDRLGKREIVKDQRPGLSMDLRKPVRTEYLGEVVPDAT